MPKDCGRWRDVSVNVAGVCGRKSWADIVRQKQLVVAQVRSLAAFCRGPCTNTLE